MPSVHFRHTQPGILLLSLLAAAACVITLAGYGSVNFWLLAPFITLLAVCAGLFYGLTTEISDGMLTCKFGPGLIRRSFALETIEHARPVRNKWYYGWGIRYTPHGWLFNVSGLDAVELELKGGGTFRIGTDRPEELVAVIERAKAGSSRRSG